MNITKVILVTFIKAMTDLGVISYTHLFIKLLFS